MSPYHCVGEVAMENASMSHNALTRGKEGMTSCLILTVTLPWMIVYYVMVGKLVVRILFYNCFNKQ